MGTQQEWAIQHFGDPGLQPDPKDKRRVVVDASWRAKNITQIDAPGWLKSASGAKIGHITCHVKVAKSLQGVFSDLEKQGLTGLIHTWDGCYVPRFQGWDPKEPPSMHTWGIAVDLNASRFPWGTEKKQDDRLVAIFNAHGFVNGASFRRHDPMHFEYRYTG